MVEYFDNLWVFQPKFQATNFITSITQRQNIYNGGSRSFWTILEDSEQAWMTEKTMTTTIIHQKRTSVYYKSRKATIDFAITTKLWTHVDTIIYELPLDSFRFVGQSSLYMFEFHEMKLREVWLTVLRNHQYPSLISWPKSGTLQNTIVLVRIIKTTALSANIDERKEFNQHRRWRLQCLGYCSMGFAHSRSDAY